MPNVNTAEVVAAATSGRQEVLSLKRFGGTDGFELLAPDMPSAGAGEVRIRVLAASVQFTDLAVTGSYARYRTLRVDRMVRLPAAVNAAEGERDNPMFPTFSPGNFDAVFDGIGEGGFVRSWASLAKGGILSAFGLSSAVTTGVRLPTVGFWLARLRVWDLWPNGKAAKFYSIGALRKAHPGWYRADLGKLFQLLADHAIQTLVAQRIGLEDVAEAHRQLEVGGVRGKIVICP